jgi:hypothetical protein
MPMRPDPVPEGRERYLSGLAIMVERMGRGMEMEGGG